MWRRRYFCSANTIVPAWCQTLPRASEAAAADKGYDGTDTLGLADALGIRTYIPERKCRGKHNWQDLLEGKRRAGDRQVGASGPKKVNRQSSGPESRRQRWPSRRTTSGIRQDFASSADFAAAASDSACCCALVLSCKPFVMSSKVLRASSSARSFSGGTEGGSIEGVFGPVVATCGVGLGVETAAGVGGTLAAVGVSILGIVVVGMAGISKEREQPEAIEKKAVAEYNFKLGIAWAIFSGLMSPA